MPIFVTSWMIFQWICVNDTTVFWASFVYLVYTALAIAFIVLIYAYQNQKKSLFDFIESKEKVKTALKASK